MLTARFSDSLKLSFSIAHLQFQQLVFFSLSVVPCRCKRRTIKKRVCLHACLIFLLSLKEGFARPPSYMWRECISIGMKTFDMVARDGRAWSVKLVSALADVECRTRLRHCFGNISPRVTYCRNVHVFESCILQGRLQGEKSNQGWTIKDNASKVQRLQTREDHWYCFPCDICACHSKQFIDKVLRHRR